MKNITLAVEDEILATVRKYAAQKETTVNGLVREYLHSLADQARQEASVRARKELVRLSEESTASMGDWKRNGKKSTTVPYFLDTNILLYAAKHWGRKRFIRKISVMAKVTGR